MNNFNCGLTSIFNSVGFPTVGMTPVTGFVFYLLDNNVATKDCLTLIDNVAAEDWLTLNRSTALPDKFCDVISPDETFHKFLPNSSIALVDSTDVVSLDFPHDNSLAVIPSRFQEDDIFLDICYQSPSFAQAFQVTATVLATLLDSISAFTDGPTDPPSITTISASSDNPSFSPTMDHHLVTTFLHASSLDSAALLGSKDSGTSVALDLKEIVYHPMIHWIPCLVGRDKYSWLPVYHTDSCHMLDWITCLTEHDTFMHCFAVLVGK
jgi:hypothetical protein